MFEPIALEKISENRINVPRQHISSKPWWNWVSMKLMKAFERNLDMDYSVDVVESRYISPVRTRFKDNDILTVRRYGGSSRHGIIVVPQRGSGYNFAQMVSIYFASRGLCAYEIVTPLKENRGQGMGDISLSSDDLVSIVDQAVSEIRSFACQMDEWYVGIFGISLGAIYSSIAFGVEPSVESAVLVHGVGDLERLIKKSNDRLAKSIRTNGYGDLSIIEPVNYIDRSKSDKLLLVNGTEDRDALAENGDKLRIAWGCEQLKYDCGHAGLVMHSKEIMAKSFTHFYKTLID